MWWELPPHHSPPTTPGEWCDVGGEWCDVVMWEVAHVSGVTHTLLLPNCITY